MDPTQDTTDYSRRFLFERANIRGQRVRLEHTLSEVFERRPYPAPVATELASALAAAALLSSTVKFDGRLTLQVRGRGPIPMLVAQALPEGGLRGIARWDDDAVAEAGHDPAALYGEAELVIAISTERDSEPYQGIVPVKRAGLGASIEHYFAQSEQLDTRVWLGSYGTATRGFLLQRLPGESEDGHDDEVWRRAVSATEAQVGTDLPHLADETFLKRLFGEDTLRLFAPTPLRFACGCSGARTASMIRALGPDEAGRILEEEGEIHVTCEFCGATYRYDALDVGQIMSTGMWTPPGGRAQ